MKQRGQSLIEVLVAVGIIVFALVGTIAATTRAVKTARVAANQTEAGKYASLVIEQIQKQKHDDSEAFFDQRDCGSYGPFGDEGEYEAVVTCDFVADEVAVKVRVSWPEGQSNLAVELNTIISKDSEY